MFFVVCMLVETLNIYYVCRELKEDRSHFVFLPFERDCNYTSKLVDQVGDVAPRNIVLEDEWRGD